MLYDELHMLTVFTIVCVREIEPASCVVQYGNAGPQCPHSTVLLTLKKQFIQPTHSSPFMLAKRLDGAWKNTGPCPKPDTSSPQLGTLYLEHTFYRYPQLVPTSPKQSLKFIFLNNILKAFTVSVVRNISLSILLGPKSSSHENVLFRFQNQVPSKLDLKFRNFIFLTNIQSLPSYS